MTEIEWQNPERIDRVTRDKVEEARRLFAAEVTKVLMKRWLRKCSILILNFNFKNK